MLPSDPLHPDVLKEKQRRLRDGFSTPLTLRVHRSLSWLRRAQTEANDLDVRFILLWIGFNAAYAGYIEASAVSPAAACEHKVREQSSRMLKTAQTVPPASAHW